MEHADADPKVLDQPWRIWATAAIASVAAAGLLLGMIVLPVVQGRNAGISAFDAICRALGIQAGSPAMPQPPSAAQAIPVTQVAWSAELIRDLEQADRRNGEAIASQTCFACHGERGFAPDNRNPNLAGQSALAIYKQLHDYRSDSRFNDQMTPIAKALDDRQLIDVTAYYAYLTTGAIDPTTAQVGDEEIVRLVERGDQSRNLPACSSCHGRRAGGPTETPSLVGQNEGYLIAQLQLYRSGERKNDIYHRMRSVARQLTDREIARLARYYSTTLRQ
ncbi:c-type cytochrome [Enterovirga aerilata]|uniref:C-type cytochrome n=1 Tax=Enterovirga aerilata TaxID=2730920 RepID=A0A849I086_9HYPH|nr:c-type cytochrome [Enterovirga sp. DB1703]NNM72752.1 c-type cytochrome [Enterovirga sp. DB1703]